MCGIAGLVDYQNPAEFHRGRLERMRVALRHRGPDGEGEWVGTHAVLAHTRLAIVDPVGGAQPMTSADGRWVITYNGEVYNHAELRATLGEHDFRTRSDTEVVLRAWQRWGEAALDRLDGMFAFFLWDTVAQSGVLVRDRLGVKPVVWQYAAGVFAFASEAKGLGCRLRLDSDGLRQWAVMPAFSGVDRLPLEGVHVLDPGGLIRVSAHGVDTRHWHVFRWEPLPEPPSAVALGQALQAAVARRVTADVPVGLFLSGGLDSTAVAAWGRSVRPGLAAFTVQFEGQGAFANDENGIVRGDDAPFAELAARALQLPLHAVSVGRQTLASDLEQLARTDDRLPAWEQQLAQLHLSRAAARHHKVVLVGDAADETHWGYDFLLDDESIAHPAALVRRLGRPNLVADGEEVARRLVSRYVSCISEAGYGGTDPMSRRLATAHLIVRYWLGRLLHNGDVHTMAFGLEARVPFSAPRVLELARRVSPDVGFRNGTEKSLLRQAAPAEIPTAITRRKKSALPFDQGAESVYRAEALRLLDAMAPLNVDWIRRLATRPGPLHWLERAQLFQAIVFAHYKAAWL